MNLLNEYQHQTLDYDGITLNYYDSGEPHVKNDRLPLVIIHGTTGTTDTHFGYLFPLLASRCRVISVDWTDILAEKLELTDLTDQVCAVIDLLLVGQKYSLLGYSLGAVVAAKIAAERNQDVQNLMLVAGWQKTDEQQALRNYIWTTLRKENSEALALYMTYCAFSPNFIRMSPLATHIHNSNQIKVNTFIDKQMELNTRIDITADVPNILAKTLVIACNQDQMVPIHHSKQLFASIDRASYIEIQSGHGVVFERPAELFQHIDHFTADPTAFADGAILLPRLA